MRIAVCGTGSMGRAIIEGVRKNCPELNIIAYDVSPHVRSTLPKGIKVLPPEKWFSAKDSPDAVIIAVKPADVYAACNQIDSYRSKVSAPKPLWISVAAGLSIDKLK